jgi:hypothetical protein
LGIDSLLVRIIVGILSLIVFKFLFECPIGGVAILKVTLIETGEEGELDVEFHLAKILGVKLRITILQMPCQT